MSHISLEHEILFLLMGVLTMLSLSLTLKAKRMLVGHQKDVLNAVSYSFLIFFVALIFHFLSEDVLSDKNLIILEHSFMFLSLLCLLLIGVVSMRHRQEWGIE